MLQTQAFVRSTYTARSCDFRTQKIEQGPFLGPASFVLCILLFSAIWTVVFLKAVLNVAQYVFPNAVHNPLHTPPTVDTAYL